MMVSFIGRETKWLVFVCLCQYRLPKEGFGFAHKVTQKNKFEYPCSNFNDRWAGMFEVQASTSALPKLYKICAEVEFDVPGSGKKLNSSGLGNSARNIIYHDETSHHEKAIHQSSYPDEIMKLSIFDNV